MQVWLKIPFSETACKCILLPVYCRCVQFTRAELSFLQGLTYAVVQWQKGTSCSRFLRCLLLVITLEITWKLQEAILLLTSYSLLVNCSLQNSLEQSTHSKIYEEVFVPRVRAELILDSSEM